eukprot:5730409-Prymnesium_polylepis.2
MGPVPPLSSMRSQAAQCAHWSLMRRGVCVHVMLPGGPANGGSASASSAGTSWSWWRPTGSGRRATPRSPRNEGSALSCVIRHMSK